MGLSKKNHSFFQTYAKSAVLKCRSSTTLILSKGWAGTEEILNTCAGHGIVGSLELKSQNVFGSQTEEKAGRLFHVLQQKRNHAFIYLFTYF